MLRFALDGILSSSTAPLRISVAIALPCVVFALLGIIYALFLRLFNSTWVQGWTALMIAILFIGGVQLLGVGILGEYVGRIYNKIKGRPLYRSGVSGLRLARTCKITQSSNQSYIADYMFVDAVIDDGCLQCEAIIVPPSPWSAPGFPGLAGAYELAKQ